LNGRKSSPSDLRSSHAGVRGAGTDQDRQRRSVCGHRTIRAVEALARLDETRDVHERIQAGRPLKEDTTKPPAASLRAQQSRFDNFRHLFNNERPHEGLNNQVPASLYQPSSVRVPRKLPEFKYPKGLLLRRVNNSGDISWYKHRVFISEVFLRGTGIRVNYTRILQNLLPEHGDRRAECGTASF
jgi:hypothetical protein